MPISSISSKIRQFRERSDRGFVLVFCSITLMMLISLGGFAVDVGNWYWKASKLQNAADAAALAGATYLPRDVNKAVAAAESSLRQNGFGDVVVQTTKVTGGTGTNRATPTAYIIQDARYPNRLHVELASTTPNYFVSLLGAKHQSLVRSANAFYRLPILMGSPGTVLGAEPAGLGPSVQNTRIQNTLNGKYWLNIAGGKTDKSNGDKYTADVCSNATSDGCAGNVNKDIHYTINDKTYGEAERSHQYVLHVPAGVAGPITLQVFDGAFVDVGASCDTATVHGPNYGVNLSQPDMVGLAASFGLPADLYSSDPNSVYCTGDAAQEMRVNTTLPPAPALKLSVYDVTGVADEELDRSQGVVSGTSPVTYPTVSLADNAALATMLRNNTNNLRATFRQWNTFATLYPSDLTKAHDYVIEARTPLNSFGNNHFSLRAGLGTPGVWNRTSTKLMSLSAKGHLAVFTNAKANDTSFYFAKITDNQAGRTIDLNLFDIGDSPYAPISLSLVKPIGATGVPAGLGACEQVGPQTYSTGHTICRISNAQPRYASGVPSYNGRNVTLHLDIPEGYRCSDDGTDKCWMGLQFTTTQPASDTTTWEVLDCGRPLRLIQDGREDDTSDCPNTGHSIAELPTTTVPPTTRPPTSTTRPPTSPTTRPSTTTTRPRTTTTRPATSPTTRPPTTTTRPQSTTTRPPTTPTTQRPTTTTIYVGGT